MARSSDWLPRSHEAFHAMVQRLINYIMDTANRERMDFGATTKTGKWFTDVYLPAVAAYLPVYDAWLDPAQRGPAKQGALEVQEEIVRPLTRELYTHGLKNNFSVTRTDLINMSLPVPSGERHDSPVAKRAPGFRFEQLDGHRVEVDFFDVESASKRGKPAGQHGIEFKLIVLKEKREVTISELIVSVFDTNPPYIFEGTDEQQGDYLMICGRWENTRGEKGPWSEIFVAVIP